MPELRDGTHVEDARLDRLKFFDEKSKDFPVEAAATKAKSKTWTLRVHNDQGQDGACVGFGTGHRLAAAPIQVSGVDYKFSMDLYHAAQKLDPWPGEDYEGTAVLAGIKAAQNLGRVGEYRWCFTLEDYVNAILTEGPVLVGTNWLDSMFDGDRPGNILDVSGSVAGGHCYILRGVDTRKKLFRITNSWGLGWGYKGDANIRFDDWENVLMPDGEGAVLYEKRLRTVKPSPQQGETLRTANGLQLGHWWLT